MRIVCLIACHFSHAKHVEYFDELLKSIIRQDISPHRTLISISKADGIDYQERTVVPPNIEIFYQERQMSQFEHYALLVDKLSYDTWVCFSDSDDIWHPRRISCYVETTLSVPNNCINICSKYHKSGTTVETAILKEISTDDLIEHWNLCVRLPFVKWFMDNATGEMKKHKFCDVLFSRWICNKILSYGLDFTVSIVSKPDNWMYFYRLHDTSTSASDSTSLNETIENNADLILAKNPNTIGFDIETYTNVCMEKFKEYSTPDSYPIIENIVHNHYLKSVFTPSKVAKICPTQNNINF